MLKDRVGVRNELSHGLCACWVWGPGGMVGHLRAVVDNRSSEEKNGNDPGVYLQREETSQKRTVLPEEGVRFPDSPVGCSRGCRLNIPCAVNHLAIPSQLTAVTVCILLFPALVSTK